MRVSAFLVFLWCLVFLMRSMGRVITCLPCLRKNAVTFPRILFCLGLCVCTSKILPMGNVLASSWTASATTRRLPLSGRRRVHRLAGRPLGTPGVTVTLRVRAAREIGCIDLVGLDWCDVGGVVELPLHGAERRRVVEGERERRGTLGLRRGYLCAAPS